MLRILILFFLTAFMQGERIQRQDLISITFKKKIIEKKVDDLTTKKKRINLQNRLQEVEFNLEFNNKVSIFQIVETLQSDYNKINNNFAQTIGGTELKVITQVDTNEKYYATTLFNEPYIVVEKANNLVWAIERETKDILGYKCQKAKTTIKIDDFRGKQQFEVYAWFTNEIPSNFGPSIFNGLPGTILELNYGDIITYAVQIRTKKGSLKKPKIEGLKVSTQEFTTIFNKKMNAIRQN